MRSGASDLADGEEPGQAGAGPGVRCDTAHPVVRGRRHRDGLDRPVETCRPAGCRDGGEPGFEQLASERGRVEQYRGAALSFHLAGDGTGDDIAWREFGVGVFGEHEAIGEETAQNGAFTPHRLGHERGAGHGQGGRVKLVELQIGDVCAGPVRRRYPVTGRDRGIGGVGVEGAGTAGGEDHGVGFDASLHVVRAENAGAAHDAALDQQVDEHRMFAHVDRGPASHGRHEGSLDGGPGRVAAGMYDPRA